MSTPLYLPSIGGRREAVSALMQEVFLPSRYDMQPGEAVQAEASTSALQGWLNRGPFRMTHRLDEPTDRYGRALRTVYRLRPGRQRGPAGGLYATRGRCAWLLGRVQGWVVLRGKCKLAGALLPENRPLRRRRAAGLLALRLVQRPRAPGVVRLCDGWS